MTNRERSVPSAELRYDAHQLLCSSRGPRLVYGRLRPRIRERAVTSETELVLDGFPRSANTYALAAVRCSNGADLRVSHHLHSAGNILSGVRRGIPVVVLVRNPADAVASFMDKQGVSADFGLRRYAAFYEKLEPHASGFVVADFAQVTTDFGEVLRSVNRRFGVELAEYRPTPENEAWCEQFVRERQVAHLGAPDPEQLALPTDQRRSGREVRLAEVSARGSLLRRAEAVYARMRTLAQ